eukprot:scaffold473_cov156-Amphora_coffeaeformis.AAC.10
MTSLLRNSLLSKKTLSNSPRHLGTVFVFWKCGSLRQSHDKTDRKREQARAMEEKPAAQEQPTAEEPEVEKTVAEESTAVEKPPVEQPAATLKRKPCICATKSKRRLTNLDQHVRFAPSTDNQPYANPFSWEELDPTALWYAKPDCAKASEKENALRAVEEAREGLRDAVKRQYAVTKSFRALRAARLALQSALGE